MPVQSPYPEFADVRRYISRIGGHEELAKRHNIDTRTAQRILSGKLTPGKSLLAEMLDAYRHYVETADHSALALAYGLAGMNGSKRNA